MPELPFDPNNIEVLTAQDLVERYSNRTLHDGQRWGCWHLVVNNLTLVAEQNGYEIDLETIDSRDAMLSRILHIHEKPWGRAALADLVTAFRDIFDPHRMPVGDGSFDASSHLRRVLTPPRSEAW